MLISRPRTVHDTLCDRKATAPTTRAAIFFFSVWWPQRSSPSRYHGTGSYWVVRIPQTTTASYLFHLVVAHSPQRSTIRRSYPWLTLEPSHRRLCSLGDAVRCADMCRLCAVDHAKRSGFHNSPSLPWRHFVAQYACNICQYMLCTGATLNSCAILMFGI